MAKLKFNKEEGKKEPILFVDDEPTLLILFSETFVDDYNVFIAENANEALQILKIQTIKVLITDQMMPVMNGIELLEIVKVQYPNIIRIMLTANLNSNSILLSINRGGVFQYLIKPWKKEDVNLAINNALYVYNLNKEKINLLHKYRIVNFKLKKREQKFRKILRLIQDPLAICDFEGRFFYCNNAFCKLTGYSSEEIKSLTYSKLVKQEQYLMLKEQKESAFKNKMFPKEIEIFSKDGNIIQVEINITAIELENKKIILSIFRDLTEHKQTEQRILNAIIQTEEKERIRTSKELHDGLGPILSTIKLYFDWVADTTDHDKKTEILAKGNNVINEAIKVLKEIANNIRPHILSNFGVAPAINFFINRLPETTNVKINFNSNLYERIDENLEISIYRIIIELINNTLKHAKAKNILIELTRTSSHIKVLYKDDGIGFDVENINQNKTGMGLFNIKSRISSFGGNIRITSSESKGMEVEIILSYNKVI